MIDTPAFDDVPEFAHDGTKVKPGTSKYTGGFVAGEMLPFDYHNWLMNGLTKNGVTGNGAAASIHAELKALLGLFGITPSALTNTQLADYFASHGLDIGYDIVIDSDDKLDEWAACTDGSMKRVYIKSGTWAASAVGLSGTDGVLIDLDKAGTTYVYAEPGSKITFSGTYVGVMYGIYHATLPEIGDEQFINVSLDIGNTAPASSAIGFHNCVGLMFCTAKSASTQGARAYSYSKALFGCRGEGISSLEFGIGFHYSEVITNCIGVGTNENAVCFAYCKKMQQNLAVNNSVATKYTSCYADSGTGYQVADTPNGGFNS
jgi:hypothetical protein